MYFYVCDPTGWLVRRDTVGESALTASADQEWSETTYCCSSDGRLGRRNLAKRIAQQLEEDKGCAIAYNIPFRLDRLSRCYILNLELFGRCTSRGGRPRADRQSYWVHRLRHGVVPTNGVAPGGCFPSPAQQPILVPSWYTGPFGGPLVSGGYAKSGVFCGLVWPTPSDDTPQRQVQHAQSGVRPRADHAGQELFGVPSAFSGAPCTSLAAAAAQRPPAKLAEPCCGCGIRTSASQNIKFLYKFL